jgi:predicted NUDIX family NTP pyrophosphohydrolase
MPKPSAGILIFRCRSEIIEVLLVHPGGPFYTKKDVWSIPKGEYEEGEDPFDAARREFKEETGLEAVGSFLPLGDVKYPSNGKVVSAWAVKGDCDPSTLHSNTFSLEWPPKSGRQQEFPEVDRAEWFSVEVAQRKLVKAQVGFLEKLVPLIMTQRCDLAQ